MKKILLYCGWGVMATMALYLSFVTLVYFSFRDDIYFLLAKQDLVHDLAWRISFYIHITGGVMALSMGPFQFLKKFRQKRLRLHRIMGKIYVSGILFLGGPAGFYMAVHANGGLTAQIGFSVLSFLWVTFTWLALRAIIKRNIHSHQYWMIRSFALTFAAVTLRLWVPLLSLVLHFNQEETLLLSPWLSWIPNLLIGEMIITYLQYKRTAEHGKDLLKEIN